MGTPTKEASIRSLALPTMALAMPPPASPTGVGSFVKKSQLRLLAPCTNKYPRIKTRVPAANSVQSPVIVSITALTVFRRSVLRSAILCLVLVRSHHQKPRHSVDHDGQGEQNQAQFDESAGV